MFRIADTCSSLTLSLALVTLELGTAALHAQESTAAAATLGTPQTGGFAVRETTAQIMARDSVRAAQPRSRHVPPRLTLPLSGAPSASEPAVSASAALKPLSPQTVSPTLNFTAATFFDVSAWPPDTMGAVGPTQFIIAINNRVRSFNKATGVADNAINTGTDSFFSSVITPGFVTTDPRIRYDRLSGRWFIAMIDDPGPQLQPNRVMIAMSDSGTITPSTVWSFFQFAADASSFADYPTLGIDANALYIGVNLFSTSGSFVNTTGFVVRKSSLLSGGPIVKTAFTGLISGATGPFTPQGVDNYDPAATEGYFIGVDASSSTRLRLRRVSSPGGTPSISGNVSITVSSFASPIAVTVQGTSGTVDGLDRRLMAAHYRNGSLWTSHNVGVNSTGGNTSPDRNGVRWYQITGIPTGQTPSVAQSGTVFHGGSPSLSYWMGTIMVSGQGHAAMGFTQGGPNNFLDAATTGRLAGYPSGTMDTPVTYTTSISAYTPSDGTTPHRWGDYSYTSLDPSDDMTMWTIQEWCQSTGNGYAVQAAQLLAPPPALPTNCTPASVTQNVANVSVVIKGSPASGAGFFDPGAGFPNHLTATVNGGGVTVNSVTYNNPTNLTVSLTIAANAPTGARTVTVTNPDGQSATSVSGLLTVLSAGNLPPTLAAISNRTIAVGMTLTITNVASDADGDQLTFSLGAGAATNATINATNGIFSWAPIQAQLGSNGFSVIVTDSGLPSLSATQSFSVLVVHSNSPPVLAAISNQTIAVGMTLTLTNVASDFDADQLTFSLGAGAAANASINPTNGVFNWSPTQAQIGSNGFDVIVTDSGLPSLSATQSFSVLVVPSNSPPVLAAISNQTTAVGMTLTLTSVASDADGDQLTFSLGAGAATNATINPTNGIFSWAPTQAQLGSNAFTIIVTDNGLPPLSATQSFSVTVAQSNSPPVLTAISDETLAVGMSLSITNVASDADGDQLTFSLGAGAAANASINPTNGIFSWAPTQAQIGTNGFTVVVTDNGLPPLSAAQSFSVIVVHSNSPPALAAISDQTIAVGMTLTITNVASDADGDQLTFSLGAGAATNATINPTTGIFFWPPTQAQVGSNAFTIIVTDNGLPQLSATQSFSVIVLASNNPPVLAPIADQTIYALTTLLLTNSATDPDLPVQTLTFSLDPGAPSGASIGPTNGVFVWAPTDPQAGTNTITVRVTDNGLPNLSDARTFTVNVLLRPVLESVAGSSNTTTLAWSAIAGTTYRIQFKTNLTDTSWVDLVPDVLATGTTAGTTDPASTNDTRFYRVLVLP